MDDAFLRQILAGGESEQVEFVAGVGREAHIEEAACAFLNARGGIILAGVGEGGRVIGVDAAARKVEQLRGRLAEAIAPPASLSVTVGGLDERSLIVIDVPQGLEKPYVCSGKIMVRRGASIGPASANDIASLISQRAIGEGRWERLPALGIELGDLDSALVKQVATRIRQTRGHDLDSTDDPERILTRLNLVRSGQFTNAAVILFGKSPADSYPQTRVRAARFRGDSRSSFIDNRVFEGNLFSLIEALMSFLNVHVAISSDFGPDQLYRLDRPAYPWPAVREAIVNALVHRDYSAFDGGMSLAIYDRRIEFWNSGHLPDEMTVEDLRTAHPSRPTNPDIAQVCFLYGLMERWGIGTQKIIRTCEENGLPQPEWKVDKNGLTLTMRLAEGEDRRPEAGHLSVRPLAIARRLHPGERLRLADYQELISSEVKSRQARMDLMQLTQAGYLKRVGAGRATVYVRTSKPVTELPTE